MSATDQLVREAVEHIFQKMDVNHDSYLDINEVISLLNSGLRFLGKKSSATYADAKDFIAYADANRDEELSKQEMFALLKKIMSRYNQWFESLYRLYFTGIDLKYYLQILFEWFFDHKSVLIA